MQDKPQIFRHFSGLKESGRLMNLDQDTDVMNSEEDSSSKKGDDIVGWLGPKEKSQLKYFGTYDDGKNGFVGEKGTRGEKQKEDESYTDYYRYKNEKRGKIFNKLIENLYDKKTSKITNNNDIINPLPMPEGMEHTPQKQDTGPATRQDQKVINQEDLELQKNIYEALEKYEKDLVINTGTRKEKEKRARNLEDFRTNPYLYMEMDLNKKIRSAIVDQVITKDGIQKKIIDNKIKTYTTDFNKLTSAFHKKIPLKLERNHGIKAIDIGREEVFNVDRYKKEINTLRKQESGTYEIVGVVQRNRKEFLVLKTDNGQVEIDMDDIGHMTEGKPEREKEEKFNNIHEGSIVSVRMNKKVTTYEITSLKDDRVLFIDKTDGSPRSMKLDDLKNFLFKKDVEFVVEESRKNQDKNIPSPNNIDKNLSDDLINEELLPVLSLEKELGFKISTPQIIERYLKVSKEEAQDLFDQYEKLEKKDEITKSSEETTKVEEDVIPLPPDKQEEVPESVEKAEVAEEVNNVNEEKQERINAIIKEMLALKEREVADKTEREEEINKDRQAIKEKEERLEKLLEIINSPTQAEEAETENDDLSVPTPPEEITTYKGNREVIKSEIERIKEEIKTQHEKLSEKGIFSSGKKELKKSIEASQALLKRVTTEDINLDIKEKPFMYFAAQKIKNIEVLKRLINKDTKSLDLRWADSPTSYEGLTKETEMIGKNEGFREFNVYGFMKVLKNANKLRSKEDLHSEEAVYKILNPDGKIVADDIKGYQTANYIYMKETEKYEKLVEEEFNKPNNL